MIGAQSLRHPFPPDADLIQPNQTAQVPHQQPAFSDHDATLRQLHLAESQREFLKTYSARLEAELKAYQMKFPDVLVTIDHDNDDLAPWTVNQQYISPLLVSYDSQLAQANCTNAELRRDLQNLKVELNKLVTRNEELESELENHIVKLIQRFDDGGHSGGIMDSSELHELNQRCALLGDENHLLRTQELESRRELDSTRNLLEERDVIISSLRNEINNYEEKVSKMNDLETHIEALQKELSFNRKQTEDAIRHMKSAQEDSLHLQVELQSSLKDAAQFKQLLKEHEIESEKCIHELKSELTSLQSQYTQSSGEASHLNQLLQDALEQNRQHQKIIESKDSDLQGMLGTIKDLEETIENLNVSNMKHMSELAELKTSLSDAVLKRDEAVQRAEHAEKQRKSECEQLSDTLQSLRTSSSNELSKAIATAKAKESRLFEDIKQLQTKCAELENSREIADRSAKSALKNFQHLQETSIRVQNEIGDTLNEARASIVRLESRLEMTMKKDAQLEDALKMKTQQYEEERNVCEEKISQMAESLKNRRSECISLTEKLNQTEDDLKQARQDILSEIAKHNAAQAQFQQQIEILKNSKAKEINALMDRIQDLNDMREKVESRSIRIQRDHDEKVEQVQKSHNSSVNQMQKTIRDLRDEIAVSQAKARTWESETNRLREHVTELKRQLESNNRQASELRSIVTVLEQNVMEKEIHLQHANEEAQKLKNQLKHLELELDKAEVAVSRERRQWEKKCRTIELKMLGIAGETNSFHDRNAKGSLTILK